MDAMKDPFGWVGETIDEQFTVEEVVGEGGFAVVYRGHHKGFDEKVAVKALKFPAKLGEDERARFLESFKSEGKLLRKLSSADAGVVQALDVGAATSPNGTWTPYLVLEWLEGETLEANLKSRAKSGAGGRSLGEAIALLDPVAHGLATAHEMGVAHRDVKPSNLFLTNVGGKEGDKRALKIVDFGIAKVMTDSEDLMRAYEATGESIHAFSPRYGAPEQFNRKFGATGPWTDVFALALVLVEVVAGRSAMKGDTSELFLAASNVASRPTLRSMGMPETDAVEAVLARAMAVHPKDRYAEAQAFWSALRDAMEKGDTILSERTAAKTKRDGAVAESKTKTAEPLPPARARRAAELAVAAILIGGMGAAAWSVLPHPSGDQWTPVAYDPDAGRAFFQSPLGVVPDAATLAVDPEHVTMPSVSGYVRYTNERYHFVIDIPNDFTKFEGAEAGDGRVYKNEAGDATLTIFGADMTGTFQELYKADYFRHDTLSHWVLPTHTLTNDMFAIAGYDENTPFMEKVVVSNGTYAKLYVNYSTKDKVHFEDLLPHTRDSFSFTAVSTTAPKPASTRTHPSGDPYDDTTRDR